MLRKIVFLFLKTKNLKIIYDGGTLALSAYFFEKQLELMRPFQKTKYWLEHVGLKNKGLLYILKPFFFNGRKHRFSNRGM